MQTCPTCQSAVTDGAAQCPVDGTVLRTATHRLVGKVLGERYRILSLLGEGGMGTVFVAEHVVLGKKMAVKVLREDLSRDEELVRRFQQEAIAASQIGHENIVDITDFGRSPEGALYFVMEKLEGDGLARLVAKEGWIPPAQAVPILVQICRALGAAHARGIVHRDLKPDNVIITRRPDGSQLVKVLDFGISKVNASGGERLTRVGMLMGTPEYMAPEQIDSADVDHRVDIYALGALAYEMLTGSVPFTASTPVALLMKHRTEEPQPLRQRRPDLDLPPALEAVVLRALAKDKDQRQQSMAALAQELASAAGLHGIFTPLPAPAPSLPAKPVTVRVTPTKDPSAVGSASRGGTMQLSTGDLAPAALLQAAQPRSVDTPAAAPAVGTLALNPSPTPQQSTSPQPTPEPQHSTSPQRTSQSQPTPQSPPQSLPRPQPRPSSAPERTEELDAAVVRAMRRRGPPKNVLLAAGGALVLVVGAALLLWPAGSGPTSPALVSAEVSPEPAAQAAKEPPPVPQEPAGKPAGQLEPPLPAARVVTVSSRPEGASVWEGRVLVGQTPLELALPPGERRRYEFRLAGHRNQAKVISAEEGRVEVELRRRQEKSDDPFQKVQDLKENPF